MSEKISKISVDGVVYDIASTGGGEVPGDIQEQLSALENKVTEEASAREEGDAKLSEKIESEASRVDGMVNQINENVASSIETLNNNLVQAIETINNGIAAEVTNREEGDAKLQAAIDELAEKVNGEGADLTELEGKIEKNAADIATVNNNLVEAVNNINKNVADGFSTINGGLNNEIRPELEKAVKYEDTATEQNPGRKTIFLNNHDNICGKTTDGSAVNIAMVSKWNKVDLGSSSVEINLNGSAERPTYNDSKQIALLEDVHGNMETIALVKKDDLTYELQVGDKIAGTINIPADQFLKSVEYSAEDKSLTFVFNTSEGEQTSVVDLSSLVDTYVAGNGIELIENGFSIKLDPSSESYLSVSEAGIKVEGINEIKKNVQEVAANLVTVNENLASSIDAINKKAVKYEDVADSNLPERKAIVLKNGDVILGGNLEGGTSSLVQLNRWGVADFGSSSVPFNINTPKDVRPTVQEAGQSGEEAHKIAYLSDVESVSVALEDKQDKGDYALKSDLEGLATETWVESKGYLTEHQDISGLATKEEVTESSNEVLTNILGRIWTNTDKEESGNFDTSYKHADGSYARIWNETDGGGSQYYNSNKDTLSFVGVNDGNDGIHVQIYSKKKSTNVGARLNATPDGIFYGVGNSASIAPENELVVKKDITEVNTNLEAEIEARSTADTQLQNDLQVEATTAREAEKANADAIVAEVSRATEKEAEIEANLASAVKFTTSTYEGRDKKVITLDNDELINARSNSEDLENKVNVGGKSISLIQLNRWNVVDVGSPYTLTNINTPKGQRPTVQEAGQSGPEANQIAYVSDVAGLSNTLEALNATVQILQSKVDVLTKTNTEVVSVDGSAGELKDSSKDYIVSGSINENAEIVGKSISLKSIKVSDNARLKLNAGDVEAKDLNISGSFPKANGNTVISVNNAEFIVFKDMVFDASEVYNGIEIGLASNSVLPKNILFDNCKFQGEFSNNAILVFGTQDNAIITLNNCYFEKISNALRLSNKSNASGVVVNINNCTVDQWETRAPWQGFLICEDYTNKTEEEVNANNLFGDGKITVNFNNLVHAGVKINPADPASVCGTKNESQVVMVCQDAVAGPEGDYCLSYDAAKFPVVSFK